MVAPGAPALDLRRRHPDHRPLRGRLQDPELHRRALRRLALEAGPQGVRRPVRDGRRREAERGHRGVPAEERVLQGIGHREWAADALACGICPSIIYEGADGDCGPEVGDVGVGGGECNGHIGINDL